MAKAAESLELADALGGEIEMARDLSQRQSLGVPAVRELRLLLQGIRTVIVETALTSHATKRESIFEQSYWLAVREGKISAGYYWNVFGRESEAVPEHYETKSSGKNAMIDAALAELAEQAPD